KLFGSVTTTEIAEALNAKTGVDINRRRISQQALREVGTFNIPVRLGTEIAPSLKVVVVREEELAEYLAAKNAPAAEEPQAVPEVVAEAVVDAVPAAES
ncbi:MAG TPA: 50S ribosomal L9 C-terminal domain-containing protein, partial [Phototrophicaceae bacterium]|nr:50S ribosomal L9 C-terminal domain-containing protein [Phototrophicaceae bacterium]